MLSIRYRTVRGDSMLALSAIHGPSFFVLNVRDSIKARFSAVTGVSVHLHP